MARCSQKNATDQEMVHASSDKNYGNYVTMGRLKLSNTMWFHHLDGITFVF